VKSDRRRTTWGPRAPKIVAQPLSRQAKVVHVVVDVDVDVVVVVVVVVLVLVDVLVLVLVLVLVSLQAPHQLPRQLRRHRPHPSEQLDRLAVLLVRPYVHRRRMTSCTAATSIAEPRGDATETCHAASLCSESESLLSMSMGPRVGEYEHEHEHVNEHEYDYVDAYDYADDYVLRFALRVQALTDDLFGGTCRRTCPARSATPFSRRCRTFGRHSTARCSAA
jgi:hypothetical protein